MNDNNNCSAFPFDLDPITVASLSQTASSFSSANGIQVERRKEESDDTVFEGAPISLLPNAYPQQAFRQAQDLAPAFNELVDRISRNGKFLEETLGGGVSAMDPFTAKILKLYREVYGDDSTANAPAKIADRLGIHRSDYMLHSSPNDDMNKNSYQLKQVELNTIASSFACLSCKIATMHQYLSSRYRTEIDGFLQNNRKRVIDDTINDSGNASPSAGVPVNPALEEIPFAIKIAYNRYVERFLLTASKTDEQPPVVLFVVQDGETNTIDQRLLEFALWEAHQIPVVRRTLTQLHSELSVDNKDGALKLLKPTGGKPDDKEIQEIAVVYFRAGYAPTDYDGENGIEWKARLTLEASRATKCPCLGYHLAGTKKVQQELARPGVLERFFPEKNEAEKVAAMRACFAGLYSCGNDATSEDIKAIRDVLDGGHSKYVLKPQREGGGYNFYGKDLADKLRKNISWTGEVLELSEDLAEFILMQRLFPPQQKAVLMRGGKIQGTGDSISELGSFGTLVVDSNGKVIHNRYAGFLLRTKFSNVDEGGVASGFATLSSPYLC
mmetsp:Transcript_13813/g.15956  ORF Transcript_13813/g.15956 Transcript_13813/m.15956 type:complete len:555 (+) Transcript_13813:2-1666(+)